MVAWFYGGFYSDFREILRLGFFGTLFSGNRLNTINSKPVALPGATAESETFNSV